MIRRTPNRPGVTLIEVMIATGILAVGMLAIMALFPIGAVSMARAINQNRCADHAANSDAMFRHYWKAAWLDSTGGVRVSGTDAYASSGEEAIALLDRKRPFNFANPPDIATQATQPSFVVVVDPIGFKTQVSFGLANVNNIDGKNYLPARTSLAAAEADVLPRTRIRLTTLLDDMSYDTNGEPANYTGQLERGGRYNVAWVIQRPKNNVPHEVRLTVLVYAGRSPTDTPSTEQTFNGNVTNYIAGVDPKPNTVTFNLGGQPMPAVHKGRWVGFSTGVTPQGGIPYATLDFYRVSSITEDKGTGDVLLEFEQPLRTYDTALITGFGGNAYTGTLIFFDNLYEVFDRGTVSATAISGR